jgi:NADH-quinone oxidoreductase subunit A
MDQFAPILIFVLVSAGLSVTMLLVGKLFGPKRNSKVKEMPYESGMDPIHDTRRRFDIHFHLVAIAFLLFDVELLFLYPWAVASKNPEGIEQAVASGFVESRTLIFGEVMVFIALLGLGFVYAWKKGVFRWR